MRWKFGIFIEVQMPPDINAMLLLKWVLKVKSWVRWTHGSMTAFYISYCFFGLETGKCNSPITELTNTKSNIDGRLYNKLVAFCSRLLPYV